MANVPNQLPFLPGNVYADPTITRYHKTQILGLTNGIITGKCHCSRTALRRSDAHATIIRKNNCSLRTCQPGAPRINAQRRRPNSRRHSASQTGEQCYP